MLRLQNFDQSALSCAARQGNSLSCGSTGFSLDLCLVGKQGLFWKVKESAVPCPTQPSLTSIQGRLREVGVDLTHQAATLCLHCLPGILLKGASTPRCHMLCERAEGRGLMTSTTDQDITFAAVSLAATSKTECRD